MGEVHLSSSRVWKFVGTSILEEEGTAAREQKKMEYKATHNNTYTVAQKNHSLKTT